tara:strand:+ start:89 stop:766 length:678 start_codon:yes stop_codon:yes gene_type:complete
MVVRMDYLNYGKQNLNVLPNTNTIGNVKSYKEPFPHLIVDNYYDKEELELIWEELNFYTKPGKFFDAKDYGGVVGYTNSRAIDLTQVYNSRNLSNIIGLSSKLHKSGVLDEYSKLHECCDINFLAEIVKVRYYHNGEYYDPHKDVRYQTLAFSYFYKQPKKFSGGELFFPNHNYEWACNNNSIIIFPAWVEHGVREVKIRDSDYYDGHGRYAITSFLFTPEIVKS